MKLEYEDMIKDARKVLDKLGHQEVEVQTTDGLWYSMRISPYRTTDNIIDGVVITFSDIGRIVEAGKETEKARSFSENIIETLREPFLVLDSDLKISIANKAFYRSFKVSAEETIGKFIYTLGNRQWDIPDLRRLLDEIIPEDHQLENYEVSHDFPQIGGKRFLLNARKMPQSDGVQEFILIAFEDISVAAENSD
jgi:two-component system CheB/CheR fusion protein